MLKKFLTSILIISVIFSASTSLAEEEYDPQHTMLALNMAIVSIHRILTTQDRIVLEQEYQNIINNLSLGNIESDYDLTTLYQDLMGLITRKRLREEDAKIFQARYDKQEQNLLMESLSNVKAYGGNLFSWLGSLAVSCVSSYFSYQDSKSQLTEDLNGELWQLQKDDITDCNDLQERLLNSSWNLLRQYKLPDNYRLVQKNIDDFYRAVDEQEPKRKLRMLRALEKDFQVYPPYWFYRAKTAQKLNDDKEAHSCFEKFNEVWRPVLRQDPYRVEAVKFKISEFAKKSNLTNEEKQEALELLEVMRANTPRDDWANNLFAGVAYFTLGKKDEGIDIVETNVDFDYGTDVSKLMLKQLRDNNVKNISELPNEMDKIEAQRLVSSLKDQEAAKLLVSLFRDDSSEFESLLAKIAERPGAINTPLVSGVVFYALRCSSPTMNFAQVFDKLNYIRFEEEEAYKDALPIIRYYVDKGNVNAHLFYAIMFINGRGVNKDLTQAVKYLKLPTSKGYFWAEYLLGDCYYATGDYKNSEKYFKLSAEKGLAEAQHGLGILYDSGKLGRRDCREALKWFKKAAEQGYHWSVLSVGYYYYTGSGVAKDIKEAYKWYYLYYLITGKRDSDMDKIEGKGVIWDSEPLIPRYQISSAQSDAKRKYEEIKKNNGWE